MDSDLHPLKRITLILELGQEAVLIKVQQTFNWVIYQPVKLRCYPILLKKI